MKKGFLAISFFRPDVAAVFASEPSSHSPVLGLHSPRDLFDILAIASWTDGSHWSSHEVVRNTFTSQVLSLMLYALGKSLFYRFWALGKTRSLSRFQGMALFKAEIG